MLGRCMSQILRECEVDNLSSLSSSIIKRNMKYFPVPEEEEWRVGCIMELLNEKVEIPGFSDKEVKEILSYLCST